MHLPEFILASRSPQRCQLLRQAGYAFRVVAPPLPEPHSLGTQTSPAQLAEALAYFKARAVQETNPDRLILAADTVVVCAGEILGQPRDQADARRMLTALSRTRHEVISGLAILLPSPAPELPPGPQERFLASETTCVTMKPMTPAQIEQYLAGGEWRDKAGAYAIQGRADAFIDRLEGSFTNVVGLPMELLERLFRQVERCLSAR